MKLKKILLLGLAVILAGCGHGYEGEYKAQAGSANELLDAFAKVTGETTLVIGPDYTDSNGLRTQFKEIFVRESGSEKYLVFKKEDGSEEAWKIADKDTLIQGGGLLSVTLKRVNK
ncbi:MAG: hypothetical protein LUQ11_06585 [Methylococcaceae bacterium]|nr:hypothetical protein [Methylococcaceae bacterium]